MTRARLSHTLRRALGFARREQGFARREDGVASMEFVLMLPAFMFIFMSTFESGLLMTRYIMLERALDMTVRDLRLGAFVFPTNATDQEKHDKIKKAICDKTVMFEDCMNIVMLELRPVSRTTWAPLNVAASCIDRSAAVNPPQSLDLGGSDEMMLVRACAVFDPLFPNTGIAMTLPKDVTGGYDLVATSAFVNEPS